jgi:outer membrane protein OmpA-like peptidoglycan-associated protein
MTLKNGLMAATILAFPALAQAQPVNGIYVGAGAGGNWRTNSTAGVDGGNLTVKTETGWAALGSVGYGLGNGLRAEIEGNYRFNSVRRSQLTVDGLGSNRGGSGSLATYGAMVNGFYDFNLTSFGLPTISPYLGAGIGYGQNWWNRVSQSATLSSIYANARSHGTNGNFAYQGIAGVAFNMSSVVPGLAATLEYRYYGVLDSSQRFNVSGGVGSYTAAGSYRGFSPSNGNHSAILGLRYNFGVAPAPMAAPAAAPPVQTVARTYLVFFDWNRADLTDRARQIIAEAASARTSVRSTRIEVSGHADRSGSDAYNQALSMRRAEAVAGELTRRGVPRADMVIQAFGESRPLVPTADGVREPQNRRVEIILK